MVGLLEKLTELPIHIEYKLETSISLNSYDSYRNAITDRKKIYKKEMRPNTQLPIFIASVADYRLPIKLPVVPGTYFSGHMSFAGDIKRNIKEEYPFRYVINIPNSITEAVKKSMTKESKELKNEEQLADKSLEDQFEEALNELKINWISK